MHLVPDECHVKQSPINIVPSEAVLEEKLTTSPLDFRYDPTKAKKIVNNGHSILVTYDCEGSREYAPTFLLCVGAFSCASKLQCFW